MKNILKILYISLIFVFYLPIFLNFFAYEDNSSSSEIKTKVIVKQSKSATQSASINTENQKQQEFNKIIVGENENAQKGEVLSAKDEVNLTLSQKIYFGVINTAEFINNLFLKFLGVLK